MAKILRYTYSTIFASGSTSTDVEQFGAQQQIGTPNYTKNPNTIQALSAWADGWSAAIISSNHAPYKQDLNSKDLVFSTGISYLYQMGIPEWDSATTYYTDSVVQNGGQFFISNTDSNLNNTPPSSASNSFWTYLPFLNLANLVSILGTAQPTRTVLNTAGSGTYTVPSGAVRLVIRAVGAGGGGSSGGTAGNGGSTIINGTTIGGGGGAVSFQGGSAGVISGTTPSIGCVGSVGQTSIRAVAANCGGQGGQSFFGGAGGYTTNTHNGTNGSNGSGGGGGADGTYGYGGGGAGAYAEIIIESPSSSYSYTVGAAGTANGTGGVGGVGLISIDEYYF